MKHAPVGLALTLALLSAALPAGSQQVVEARQGVAAPVAPGSVLEFGTMWTFEAPPVDYWRARYGLNATKEWLDHLRLSTIRLPGCSSSFVSEDGLVMTNHHCARGCIAAVSPEGADYMKDGYVARDRTEEPRCPGVYVDQLVGMEDVTERIHARVVAEGAEERAAQRDAVIGEIQDACETETGDRCQVVSLYSGGSWSLYRYRRFDDVRLVMAPELDAAYFGGDPDNFTYPRFDLDVTFLRVWEDGAPHRPEHFLSWSEAGAVEDEPVFVVGNPGSTGRLLTLGQMEYLRDVTYPATLAGYDQRLRVLRDYTTRRPETFRTHQNTIFGIENSKKATTGYRAGLLDAGIMARKKAFEDDFRSRIMADPALSLRYGDAWDRIEDAQLELATFATAARYYGFGGSTLLGRALNLVRLARQGALPETERLPAFQGAGLQRARQALLTDQALDLELEELQLTAWLEAAQAELGASDPLVKTLIGPRVPAAAAHGLVRQSRLVDLEERRALVEGGLEALQGCSDPLVAALLELEATATSYAKRATTLNAEISASTERLGRAIFEAYGTALPPDATFTLRISDGVVKGFPYNGTVAPYKTSFFGLYARSTEFDGQPPFALTERWTKALDRVDLTTPFNFVSTNDIIGGNSGSPVVNRDGEVVGLVFDGNIEMLPNRFIFTEEVSRTVSVHSRAIIEALRKVYDAGHVADELTRARR